MGNKCWQMLWVVVVVQLVERTLQAPEVRGFETSQRQKLYITLLLSAVLYRRK